MWFKEKSVYVKKRSRKKKKSTKRGNLLFANAKTASDENPLVRVLGLALVILIALCGLLWLGHLGLKFAQGFLFAENDQYTIEHIDIETDRRLRPQHIKEYAGVNTGMNLFEISIREVEKQLESVPQIRDAEVQRILPDTLKITITERQPIAYLGRNRGGLHLLVDGDGYLVARRSQPEELPRIIGLELDHLKPGVRVTNKQVMHAVEIVEICDHTRLSQYIHIRHIDASKSEKLKLLLFTGHQVTLGRKDIEQKLWELVSALRHERESGLPVQDYDLSGDEIYIAKPVKASS